MTSWWRAVPVLHLSPAETAAGDDVVRMLEHYEYWPFRYRAVAVNLLPPTFDAYLRGRSRQAVRTNRRRALGNQLELVRPASAVHSRELLQAFLGRHHIDVYAQELLQGHLQAALGRFTFVLDAADVPQAVAVHVVADHVAYLAALQVGPEVDDRSATRFLLSTDVIAQLIDAEVTHLLAGSMLYTSSGVVYLEQRLGFHPMHVKIDRARRRRARQRGEARSTALRLETGPAVGV